MAYCFSKSLNCSFDQAKTKTIAALQDLGFGVLTEIDVQATLKKKLDVDFYRYQILGACNPKMAYQALQAEDKIGTMLPCNVILQQKTENGTVEISAIDPMASMQAVENRALQPIAETVQKLLQQVIENIR